MPYVVTGKCVQEVYAACVQTCPVDCMHYVAAMPQGYPMEGHPMVVIDPDECIDCGVCEPECPAEAIVPDTEPDVENWLEINTKFAAEWPNITRKGDTPVDADEWKDKPGKLADMSSSPGAGD